MAFIGVITAKKSEDILKKTLTDMLKIADLKLDIITINETNIENMKNIKFDTIIMHEENPYILNRQNLLKKMLSQTSYLLLNVDAYSNIEIINRLKLTIITYGLNLKATVTASSIEKERACICIQRGIKNIKGTMLEPREVILNTKNTDIYKIMIGYILEILYS